MALWPEIQVKRDLRIPLRKPKPPDFSKIFKTPPHVEYAAREKQTAIRLRRLMGTNVVYLTNLDYMRRLEERTVEVHGEDLRERIGQRARRAAEIEHLELWETVLRGQCKLSPKKLHDTCMREIREHQVMIEGLQQKADKLGTSVLRVAAQPKVWVKPSRWKPPQKKEENQRKNGISEPVLVSSATQTGVGEGGVKFQDMDAVKRKSSAWRTTTKKALSNIEYRRLGGRLQRLAEVLHCDIDPNYRMSMGDEKLRHKDRRESRVMPRAPPPVEFPKTPPPFLILTADPEGKRVIGALTSMDYIFPKYYWPHAPLRLRQCQNLTELYKLSKALFDANYPPMDSTDWQYVMEKRAERKTAGT